MQLVINTPGTFLTQKDECFRLKQKEKVFDISPLKVESIVISNQAMITTQAVVQALENNIDVIFLDKYGDPIGRIWFAIKRKASELEGKRHDRFYGDIQGDFYIAGLSGHREIGFQGFGAVRRVI
jgi:CRISPR/Cas system-associated endonuclease Cas1